MRRPPDGSDTTAEETLDRDRRALLAAVVANLEQALPRGTPKRAGNERHVWHVVADHLTFGEVRGPLNAVGAGPGGEMTPTRKGQVPICSAESSALMAVNLLSPFAIRSGPLLGVDSGTLHVERQLRVTGVRAPVGPTLDAVYASPDAAVAVEAKVAEPWRSPPKVDISSQYDGPATAASAGTAATVNALRAASLRYSLLDGAQLLKHLLGVRSAIDAGDLPADVELVLLHWRPSETGSHTPLFDRLEAELDDLAARVDDQPVRIRRRSTSALLADWSTDDAPGWLRAHAERLRPRYDQPLD